MFRVPGPNGRSGPLHTNIYEDYSLLGHVVIRVIITLMMEGSLPNFAQTPNFAHRATFTVGCKSPCVFLLLGI
jgi:hypothetical protein